jgi:hypothetical protein
MVPAESPTASVAAESADRADSRHWIATPERSAPASVTVVSVRVVSSSVTAPGERVTVSR